MRARNNNEHCLGTLQFSYEANVKAFIFFSLNHIIWSPLFALSTSVGTAPDSRIRSAFSMEQHRRHKAAHAYHTVLRSTAPTKVTRAKMTPSETCDVM